MNVNEPTLPPSLCSLAFLIPFDPSTPLALLARLFHSLCLALCSRSPLSPLPLLVSEIEKQGAVAGVIPLFPYTYRFGRHS
jgi:L-cystine uptake protein TcyP (sodium:dicarboxylate symporter family)